MVHKVYGDVCCSLRELLLLILWLPAATGKFVEENVANLVKSAIRE